jgi:hypothetical protein
MSVHLPRPLTRIPRIGVIALACLLAGLALGVGLMSTAASPSPSAEIKACVANNTGMTRIVAASTNCFANEHVVTWSASAPATGSETYFASLPAELDFSYADADQTVLTLNVPAGSYLIQGDLNVRFYEPAGGNINSGSCGLSTGPNVKIATELLQAGTDFNLGDTPTLRATATFAVPTTVTMFCNAGGAFAQDASLSATTQAAIYNQSTP